MKNGRLIKDFILVVIFSFIITACSFHKNVKSVEIIKETVPEVIVVGTFDEVGIKALIAYDDEISLVGVSYIKLVGKEILGTGYTYGLQILY